MAIAGTCCSPQRVTRTPSPDAQPSTLLGRLIPMRPYPSYWRRFLATAIDVLTVGCVLWGMAQLYGQDISSGASLWLFIVGLPLYEALLTWYACTPGQAILAFRVRNSDDLQRISLSQALARVALKYLVGTVQFLSRRRANHDVLSGTILVHAALVAPDLDART
jgi:uncharacterized RDD family membrane protein YckC